MPCHRMLLWDVSRELPTRDTMQGWGQARLHRVRTAMGTLQRPGQRNSGGQVGRQGFFSVVLHAYLREAEARRLREYYVPDEERANLMQ
jgi:hypothetical protein